MSWTKVLSQDELPLDARKVVKVEQRAILLLNHKNKIYAVDNICPHLKLPMNKGKVTDNEEIICPFHRSCFKLDTGNVVEWTPFPPGVGKVLGMISKEKQLPVFPTRIEEGSIWVEV
ncbi:Rieske (2Fe-2S) protein [Calothrix sp. PCC 6303]|uniref:Rieske (2Fe-2S) protein n=1 Tax=Calothrix sp. PCC 6303 TaxID=1170562 RepID=UPI0002A018CC|nr:Rieske (2Fe-2S) protein [Calothrix sp. PCC 6303]AFZ00672.1 Rieske (2Fe-2S) iron-sulfur domain protein [Calothrix sp. PCC 6303]